MYPWAVARVGWGSLVPALALGWVGLDEGGLVPVSTRTSSLKITAVNCKTVWERDNSVAVTSIRSDDPQIETSCTLLKQPLC